MCVQASPSGEPLWRGGSADPDTYRFVKNGDSTRQKKGNWHGPKLIGPVINFEQLWISPRGSLDSGEDLVIGSD